jgi:AsmA protein
MVNRLGPISLEGTVKGDTRKITLENLKTVIGGIPLRGTLSAALSGQPSFGFKLAAEEVSLDRFFRESPSKARQAEKSWDFRALRDVQAKGSLWIDRLRFRDFELRDASIPVALENGRLTAEPLTARLYDGELYSRIVLGFTRSLRFDGYFSAKEVDMSLLSPGVSSDISLGGKMDVSLDLSGNMTGIGSVAKTVNGSWRFIVREGSYGKLDKSSGAPKGKPTFFDSARASGGIKSGVARSADFVLRGENLVMSGGGFADFNNNTLDCDFVINMKKLPDIPVRIHGDFKDSKTTVSVGQVVLNTLVGIPKGIFEILGDIAQGAWNLRR